MLGTFLVTKRYMMEKETATWVIAKSFLVFLIFFSALSIVAHAKANVVSVSHRS